MNSFDAAGTLIMESGKLYLVCAQLDDRYMDQPRRVPLSRACPPGVAEEVCGFTRWSVGIRVDGKFRVLRSFEAKPYEYR